MIRDPSDGSVREPKKIEMTSGLSTSPENIKETERLLKSREWLLEYFKKRETA